MRKKVSALSFVLAIMLILGQCLIPALAAASCNHHYVLDDTDYSGYGGRRYRTVPYCSYISYSHQHYRITGTVVETYVCEYCGDSYTVTREYVDYEAGDFCVLHDVGKITDLIE